MDEWIECKLADACESINYGLTASASEDPVGPHLLRITYIVGGNIDWSSVPYVESDSTTTEKYLLQDGDIVLARTGASTGTSMFIKRPPKAIFASYLVRLKINYDFDSQFVAYFLKSNAFLSYIHGVLGDKSAQPNASASTMKQAPMRAPRNIDEQRQIGSLLGTLEDKIDLNRRTNETLEAMARAIFKDWFVDFGPTRAMAEGRVPYLAPEIWELFPEALDEEDKPVGWCEASIYEFSEVVYGAPFTSKQFNSENIGVPLIRIRDLATHAPGVSTEQVHKKGHLIEPGDIIVGMDGEFRLHIWKGQEAWLNQRVCHFEPKSGIPKSFLAEALKGSLDFFERSKIGTTVIHLGKSDIDTLELTHPGDGVLDAFATIVEPLLERTVSNALESRTLAQTRDLLLPKLMSGEIRLREAEKAVEAVL